MFVIGGAGAGEDFDHPDTEPEGAIGQKGCPPGAKEVNKVAELANREAVVDDDLDFVE